MHAAPYNASLGCSDDTNEQSQRSRAARDGHNAVTSPNLRDYESSKFELAEILRAIKSTLPKERADLHTRITELFTRLAEDRFNLVVVGRFSRGKSTLMHAILGVDRLPMGILPLTSVITSVAYASREDIRIEFEHDRMDYEIRMSELADYITERGNPRNIKRIARARGSVYRSNYFDAASILWIHRVWARTSSKTPARQRASCRRQMRF